MRVLAIDTALEACSAAVLDTNSGIAASETLVMTRGHAEAVTPLIARVMSAAAIEFVDLDRIAVTTGPGSFTGLRVGISAALITRAISGVTASAWPRVMARVSLAAIPLSVSSTAAEQASSAVSMARTRMA